MESEPSKNSHKSNPSSIKDFFKNKDLIVVIYLVIVLVAASNFLQEKSISDHEYQIATGSVPGPAKELLKYSLSGISIGDDISSLSILSRLPSIKENIGDYTSEKYSLKEGGRLHLIYSRNDKKILYIATDWEDLKTSIPRDFEGFVYGKTTLKDLNHKTGSNGYAYTEIPPLPDSDDGSMISLNSYDLEDSNNQVVTFVMRVTPSRVRYLNENNISTGMDDEFKLASVILADSSYLTQIWGQNKTQDKSYKPIRLH
jgi:hypothetical protein